MDLGISGRRAAVAAASGGLGLGAAKALVADGVQVAICGRDPDRLAAAVAELEAIDGAGSLRPALELSLLSTVAMCMAAVPVDGGSHRAL